RADFEPRGHPVHHPRVSGFADRRDASVADADVGLANARRVDDHDVGDHEIGRAGGAARMRRLAHAVTNHLAAAELRLVAIHGGVVLDFDDQIGIGEADAVAGRGAVVIGVGAAVDAHGWTGAT